MPGSPFSIPEFCSTIKAVGQSFNYIRVVKPRLTSINGWRFRHQHTTLSLIIKRGNLYRVAGLFCWISFSSLRQNPS